MEVIVMLNRVHFNNLIDHLEVQLHSKIEETENESKAFTSLAADWLGYDLPEENITDGKDDKGIDFWFSTDSGFELYQVKSHKLTESGKLKLDKFNNEGINDLRRAAEFFLEASPKAPANQKITQLRKVWDMAIARRRLGEEPEPFDVFLKLVIFGRALTESAQSEFDTFKKIISREYLGELPINFRTRLINIDEILDEFWLKDNREWKDKNGKKKNTIDLFPEGKEENKEWMRSKNSAVFYARAYDLIAAFDTFGYQIFEPNVRAHISRSKVNAAIRTSLMYAQTRKEFRFLNNGITMTCKGFRNPTANRTSFRITEPGVVNGLQTVVALHQAYNELDHNHKKDLEKECYVMVRLLHENAVDDINRVVLATNTQNPMQPRNLKSNTEEQILYEKLFAEMGWFYERKQGAWDAFSDDPSRWRSLSNYKKKHFLSDSNKIRKVDNHIIAQTWLSFIGLSDEAVHKKIEIFDDEALYKIAFLGRSKCHASQKYFQLANIEDEIIPTSPAPQIMIASYFAREFARQTALTAIQAREEAKNRLSLDPNAPKETVDIILTSDPVYVQNRVLSGMSFLFVEFFGYLLFSAFGEQIHEIGNKLLRIPSISHLLSTGNYEKLVKAVRKGKVYKKDLLVISWFAFNHILAQMLGTPWKDNYFAAGSKTRFYYSKQTRETIYSTLSGLDQFMEVSQLTTSWTVDIPKKTTLSQYFKKALD